MKTKQIRDDLVALGDGAYTLAYQVLRDADDAADAVQDAIVAVLGKPRAYDPARGALRPWFFRVVRNRALDLLKQRRPGADLLDGLSDPTDGPESMASAAERDRALWDALMRLDEQQRATVLMRDYLGLSYAEIAAVAEIPAGTVMSRLHRGRLRLRENLTEEDVRNE